MYQNLENIFKGKHPGALSAIQIPATMRLAVLAPHPDDFDAIGITMRFFRDQGNPIEVAVLTSGASGVEDGFGGAFTPEAKGIIRESEQRASCHFFGLPESKLTFLYLTEDGKGDPAESGSNLEIIREYLELSQPELVFLPHGNDTNVGHQRSYAFFRKVAQTTKMPRIAFLNRDPKTIAMRYDFYLGFGTEAAQWKGELLRFHQSQQQRNLNTRRHGFDERILQFNRQNAEELGLKEPYAEAFELEYHCGAGEI